MKKCKSRCINSPLRALYQRSTSKVDNQGVGFRRQSVISHRKMRFAITLTLNNHPHSQNRHQTRTKIIEHPGGYSFMIFWNKICQFWESDYPMQNVEGVRHGGRAGYYYEK